MSLISSLQHVVGDSHVLSRPSDLSAYQNDWTGRWHGSARAVILPKTTAEVHAVVELCSKAGVSIVPQGGNTSLVGGAVPQDESIVVSTKRMSRLGDANRHEAHITVEAGVLLSSVETAARRAGFRYGIDFAARGSATIGGTIATNAGGHHVARYGMTRQQLLGIEAVLGNGSVISHLGGLAKDNTGYDLASLLCGSEGTLGIVTQATLRLRPATPFVATALMAFTSLPAAVEATIQLRSLLPEVEAIELMFRDGLEAVAECFELVWPLSTNEVVLLVETASTHDHTNQLLHALSQLNGVVDSAVTTNSTHRDELWRWRDLHTEAILRISQTPPHKLDITLHLEVMESFFVQLRTLLASNNRGTRLWLFGHLGDGNIHVNITGLEPNDDTVDEAVLTLVANHGGSISAEHGIGRAKAQYLYLNRQEEEIQVFRAIKNALDPKSVFNPGVLLPG